ncbi:MAG TPA: FKBP-type peptidyl-prolyl cis-trans isomerase, partial [Pyrinomonadaceae bacterium]|nr:FKBP-type peptidyl-prolyl cis-trans isomerase [Pyrinomonadaceae bacterium]
SFPVGGGRVIEGWDEALQKLRVGDHATLIIPPSIGYGAEGAGGVIPPNATLIFIIEVLGVK